MEMEPRTRSRTKDGVTGQTIYYLHLNHANWTSTPPYMLTYEEESITDVVTIDFNQRIADGEVINNPMSYEKVEEEVLPSEVYYSHWENANPDNIVSLVSGSNTAFQLQRCTWTGYKDSTLSEFSFDAPSLAKTKALANVDSTPYEFFEDLMEIRETIHFLMNPLASLSNLARAFRRKHDNALNIKDAIKRAEALADLWNNTRFAMMPLVRSIMTTMEYLADKDITRPGRRNAHGYAFDKKTDTSLHEPWTGGVGTQTVYQYTKEDKADRKVHASILYEVTNPLVDVNFALGLRQKDIPVVAWELVPLSFVFDRLWNLKALISSYLNLADPNVSILSGSVTDRVTTDVIVRCVGKYSPYSIITYVIQRPDGVRYSKHTHERTVWQPSVVDIVPPITGPNLVGSLTKILDLIALTISRLPK